MIKNLLLAICLFLIGVSYSNNSPVIEQIIVNDTVVIRDTVLIPINRHHVLLELKKQNVPHAKIVLNQSLLESNHYKSKLSKTHKNIFGLRKGKEYRKYNSYEECISDYKRLISSRYKGGDYYQFLKKIGYAEDNSYIEKLKEFG